MAHPNEVLGAGKRTRPSAAVTWTHCIETWAENIRWHSPGRGPLAGDYEGTAQIIEFPSPGFPSCRGARSVLTCAMFLPVTTTP